MPDHTTAAARAILGEADEWLARDKGSGFPISRHLISELSTQLRAALSAAEKAGSVGEGWKLVPVEPTDGMVSEGFQSVNMIGRSWNQTLTIAYRAMLAASPTPPIPASETSEKVWADQEINLAVAPVLMRLGFTTHRANQISFEIADALRGFNRPNPPASETSATEEWPISKDGPHPITDARRWLAHQLMDSKLSDIEAFDIVGHHSSIFPPPPAPSATPAEGVALEGVARPTVPQIVRLVASYTAKYGKTDYAALANDILALFPTPALPNELVGLSEAAVEWVEIDDLTSPPCTVEMLRASDISLFKAVRTYARSLLKDKTDER